MPPFTEVALSPIAWSAAGFTVSVAVLFTPAYDAVIVTAVGVVTPAVLIVNTGETEEPPATVTEAGTEAAVGFELESETGTPPAGAVPISETAFDFVGSPPPIADGESASMYSAAGSTWSVAVFETEP